MSPPLLGGRYELGRELGRGGMGRVVLARDTFLDRNVAVKTLVGTGGVQERARFVEESQITGQLTHPNIVPIHELGVDGPELFLVMKRVEGRTLASLVKALGAGESEAVAEYGLRRRLRLFLKLCEAVGYAHARGVMHRDLKPANVMLTSSDEVLVLDWGLAKPFDAGADATESVRSVVRGSLERSRFGADELQGSADLTHEGALIGTPAYMPPEQADGQPLSARADVYALGSTLYELLALKPPYRGSAHKVVMRLLEAPPPPPREAAPAQHIPRALEAIVLQAMDREPGERYADAAELADEVERFLDGRRVRSHEESVGESLRRLVSRHKVASAMGVLGFLLLNVLFVVATVLVLREEEAVSRATERANQALSVASQKERDARWAGRLAELAARAEELAGRAVRQVIELRELAKTSVPLLPGEAFEGDERAPLSVRHGEALAELAARREELLEVFATWQELVEREDAPGDAAPPPINAMMAELDAQRRALDEAFAEALVARAPGRALQEMPALGLGPEEALLNARAQLRLGRRREAAETLGELPRTELSASLAARVLALEAVLTEAPLKRQRQRLDEAIALDPTRAWLYLRRAECRAAMGDLDGADTDYDEATALRRTDAWVYSSRVLRTHAPFSQKEVNAHVVQFIRLLAPENREAELVTYLSRLWRHGDWKAFQKSVRALVNERALSALGGDRFLAQGALLLEGADAAEAYARRVLEVDLEDRVGLGCLAEAQLLREELGEARRTAERGLLRFPDDGRLNNVFGRVLAREGRRREALPFLRKGARPAIVSDPWRHLGACLAALEDRASWEEGVEAIRRAMRLDPFVTLSYHPQARPIPGDPRLHRLLAQLRRQQGRKVEASLHALRAYIYSRPESKPAKALGVSFQDLATAGELHEELALPDEAAILYEWAAEDPDLREEMQARVTRLRGR